MVTDSRIEKLCGVYEVSPRYFPLSGTNENNNKENVINNISSFFSNGYVRKLLLEAKDTIFSRIDTPNPKSRFRETLEEITKFMYGISTEKDFSVIRSSGEMRKELARYNRIDKKSSATAKRIKKRLIDLFGAYQEEFVKYGIRPCVFGSLRYGDASEYSDINLMFLVSSPKNMGDNEEYQNKVKVIVEEAEARINNVYGNEDKNKIRDVERAEQLIVDLNDLNSVLIDVEEGETTCFEDYQFEDNDFYPYSWIIEGIPMTSRLGHIERETNYIKNKMKKCASKDPIFELLLCLSYYFSLEKRKQNLCRT